MNIKNDYFWLHLLRLQFLKSFAKNAVRCGLWSPDQENLGDGSARKIRSWQPWFISWGTFHKVWILNGIIKLLFFWPVYSILIGRKLSHDVSHLDKGLFANEICNEREIKPKMHRIELEFGSFCKILEQIIFIMMIHQPISIDKSQKFRIFEYF